MDRGTRVMVTFEAGSSKYLNYLRVVKNASEHTLRNYSLDLTAFNQFFDSKKPFLISAVDKRSIRAYLAGLAAKNASKKNDFAAPFLFALLFQISRQRAPCRTQPAR